MKIAPVEQLDMNTIHRVLTSQKLSENQKIQFINNNKTQIQQLIETRISGSEYKSLMKSRPLQKFKPIKNSFTKRCDKILLAKALAIEPSEVNDYIENVSNAMSRINELDFLPAEKLDTIKTYVYRHGSKTQVVNFLDYELNTAKDKLKVLYRTLEYHSGGVADYFIRPIHRMDNKTMLKIYNVVDKNLKTSREQGLINETENLRTSEWALYRIYEIQNNSKFINAVKTYKILSE